MENLYKMKSEVAAARAALTKARDAVRKQESFAMAKAVSALAAADHPLTCKEIMWMAELDKEVSPEWLAANLSAVCRGNEFPRPYALPPYHPSKKFSTKAQMGEYRNGSANYTPNVEHDRYIENAAPVTGSRVRTRHFAELDDNGNVIKKWDRTRHLKVNTYTLAEKD